MNHSLSQASFSESDIRQIVTEGLTLKKVLGQINLFQQGVSPVSLNRPCIIGDGIVTISDEDMSEMIALYEEGVRKGRMMKFVPASGAASRMFKNWHSILDTGGFDSEEAEKVFFESLRKYAFLGSLDYAIDSNGESLEGLMKERRYRDILRYILTTKGLNYANLPKALLKFHRYPYEIRTALEEHLVEAILYTQDANHICRIHFTVSEEHKKAVHSLISRVKKNYEGHYSVILDVMLSTQRSSTNTIAVDMKNHPFRDPLGCIVFRPGGHGALLENLNELNGDIIYLKNIDNVVPDRLKPVSVLYKKILGGYLIKIQDEIFRYLHLLESKRMDEAVIKEMLTFCSSKLYMSVPLWFRDLPLSEKCTYLFDKMNRPIRICGMVKNEGEPGGGPFWVDAKNGTETLSLQIIEESQLDTSSPDQKAIWSGATHFNPVDLVCGVRDYRFQKFNLQDFVDTEAFYISIKSEKGMEIKALELPGLWNGSMAYWNTIFVEVPIETFNPVKTIDDLLRPEHLVEGISND